MPIILRGAIFLNRTRRPALDIKQAVGGKNYTIILRESADIAVKIIGKVGAINADGGDIVYPVGENGAVFIGSEFFINGTAGGEDEVIRELVAIIAEV